MNWRTTLRKRPGTYFAGGDRAKPPSAVGFGQLAKARLTAES
jgi:hypothetical protein